MFSHAEKKEPDIEFFLFSFFFYCFACFRHGRIIPICTGIEILSQSESISMPVTQYSTTESFYLGILIPESICLGKLFLWCSKNRAQTQTSIQTSRLTLSTLIKRNLIFLKEFQLAMPGFEPGTSCTQVGCSTTELLRLG